MVERRVLWAGTVRTKPLNERLDAAAKWNFTHLTLFPTDVRRWESEGLSLSTMKAMMADWGIKLLAMDPYGQWVAGFEFQQGYPELFKSHFDFGEAEIFRMAEGIGAYEINAVEPMRGAWQREYPIQQLVDSFGTFSDRAHQRGFATTLEFMPISGVSNLATAWDIVSRAGRPNTGICFDTWHFFRSGSSLDLLATIPGRYIGEIQLADGAFEPVGGDLIQDLLKHRVAPGDGEFPIAEIVRTLKDIGGYRSVGPEVFSEAYDAMSCEDAVRAAAMASARWE